MIASPPPIRQSALLLLFPASLIAGYGLGLLALAASLPAAVAPALPVPGARAVTQPIPGTPGATQGATWAPLFGVAAPLSVPAAPPPPEPEPVDEPPAFYDTSHYVLRGLVYQVGGGWAFIETDSGVTMIGRGDLLPGGETVTQIFDDGIEISVDGEAYFIGFEEPDGDAPPPDPTTAPPLRAGQRPDFRTEFRGQATRGPDPRFDPAQASGPGYTSSRDRYGLGSVGR
jgi:hypothetical protein